MTMRKLIASGTVLAGLMLGATHGDAHKPITSKYTYADDVFPIFRDRCGACHVAGGAAPMSLLTYQDAVPWAVAIRDELMAAHMPPWDAEDGFGQLKNAHTLSASELDAILVWANGGTPQGDRTKKLHAPALERTWTLGSPDVALQMPSAFTLPADKLEDTREFVLPAGTARLIRRSRRSNAGQVCGRCARNRGDSGSPIQSTAAKISGRAPPIW